MKSMPKNPTKKPDFSGLSAAELSAVLSGFQQQLADQEARLQSQASLIEQHENTIQQHADLIQERDQKIRQRDTYIQLLEELLRLKNIQKFAAKSEKLAHQHHLFDEAELETAIDELRDQLPDDVEDVDQTEKASRKRRQRGFADSLVRERIELLLSEEEKAGAVKTFFTKVKEEIQYIPAQLKVLEYWQEKAVFEQDGQDRIIAAERPVHPLGKCIATISLLAYIITSKYADGLPLYRLEKMLKRLGHEISRTCMANWIIRLDDVFKPLMTLMREVQNGSDYLQADETRIQVLKEDGKTAQSDKWMWIVRGGPPDQPVVLFDYDPSRAGSVPVRLLEGFTGILQADGYSGYGQVCRANDITRIGCWDHARRKFVEASRAASTGSKGKKANTMKADVALGYINKLYAIEKQIKDASVSERHRIRQELSLPQLAAFKTWLETNASKVLKGSLTRIAMEYTLNQWDYLVGYCERGDLNISNVLAENAIRPFAIGRKAWLFADTAHGARASATCYSLIETAKANGLEPSSYIQYVLEHIATADTLEKLEHLLPWNVPLKRLNYSSSGTIAHGC